MARTCTEILRLLPDAAAQALRSVPDVDTPTDPWHTPDLGPAVLACEIARRYRAAQHPDDIGVWVAEVGLAPEGDAVTELIVPACELYRTGRLPFPRWWRPDELTGTLLRWYARWRLTAANEGVVAAELVQRWGRSEDEAIEILVNASAPIVDAPAIFVEPGHDPPSRWLRKVAGSKEFREVVDAALAHYPAALDERDDLLAIARYRETHGAIAARLNDAEGWRDPVVDRAVEQLNAAYETSTQALLSLAPYERRLLEPAGALESLFARAMEIRRNTVFLESGGGNPLPDRVLGSWQATEWLADYVYQQGGRILRRSAGPIAHWTLVLDDPGGAAAVAGLLDDPDYMPRGGLASTPELAAFQLVLDDDPDDPLMCEFTYDDSEQALLDLVVLIQARIVRLDVFALRDGALVGVGTRGLAISQESLAPLLERAAPRVEALLRDEATVEETRFGIDTADEWARFLAIDSAKSTDLLAALDPALIVGVGRPSRQDLDAYREARLALLDARVSYAERARDGDGDGDRDDGAVEEARTRYVRTVEQLRSGGGRSVSGGTKDRTKVARLVKGLVDDRKAVLTLTLGRSPADNSTHLAAQWVTGAGRRRSVGDVDVSSVSLEQLQAAVDLPLEEPSDLDAMIHAAPTLGRELVAPLIERGVRELTVLPVSFLHALPLHLWPATEDLRGDRLIDAFDTISYAPSAALLQQLAKVPQRPEGTVVAAGYGSDLRFVSSELESLSQSAPGGARLLTPATKQAVADDAARAGVLHLACHGKWIIGDYWSSGLALAGSDMAERWLSVAEIQREFDLRGAELVCLSACDSGVSAADLWRVDDYMGIDGSFLACGARAVVSTLWAVTDAVALLFTATLYRALSTGESLTRAYRMAVSMLATGEYRAIDASHPVGALLARAGVDWPNEVRDLDDWNVDLSHPFHWGVFKLSGLVGEPIQALRPAL